MTNLKGVKVFVTCCNNLPPLSLNINSRSTTSLRLLHTEYIQTMKNASYHPRRRTETIVFHQPNQSFKNTDERGEDSHDPYIFTPVRKNDFQMGKSGTINLKLVMRGEKRMNEQYLPFLWFYSIISSHSDVSNAAVCFLCTRKNKNTHKHTSTRII